MANALGAVSFGAISAAWASWDSRSTRRAAGTRPIRSAARFTASRSRVASAGAMWPLASCRAIAASTIFCAGSGLRADPAAVRAAAATTMAQTPATTLIKEE